MDAQTPPAFVVQASDVAHIMPHTRHLEANLPFLQAAMIEAEINTPQRAAAFLAQLAHESMELRFFEELSSGAIYEGRKDLGNTQPGDGPRFKGRGPIQLTGRANYRAAGKALGVDLEGHPELAATRAVGFRVAAWYWRTHGLNTFADMDSASGFEITTRRINGGLNGQAFRLAYYVAARKTFGLAPLPAPQA